MSIHFDMVFFLTFLTFPKKLLKMLYTYYIVYEMMNLMLWSWNFM